MTSKDERNIIPEECPKKIFAALKLIEILYQQGKIPKHVYVNICREYNSKCA